LNLPPEEQVAAFTEAGVDIEIDRMIEQRCS
jgi:hypothetical protein